MRYTKLPIILRAFLSSAFVFSTVTTLWAADPAYPLPETQAAATEPAVSPATSETAVVPVHAVVPVSPPAPVAPAPVVVAAQPGLREVMTGGKPSADLRYRNEVIRQGGLPKTARASTLRATVGYETKPFYGLSAFGQAEGVYGVGREDKYRILSLKNQNHAGYPVILDPLGTDINQAFLKYDSAAAKTVVKWGRQELNFNNGRIVSFSAWRQNHQSFDALSAANTSITNLNVTYAFAWQVNRVTGDDAKDSMVDMRSHLFNIVYKLPDMGNIALYGTALDYELAPLKGQDTKTFGLRLTGPYKVNGMLGILYGLEYAQQSAFADQPNTGLKASYAMGEAGVSVYNIGLMVGMNVLSGSSKDKMKFTTPLAHPHNGWVEKFGVTPNDGLKATYVSLGGPIAPVDGLSFSTIYYDFSSQSEYIPKGAKTAKIVHLGTELNAGMEYKIVPLDKNWAVGGRLGNYMGDEEPALTDTARYSLYTQYSF